MSDYLIAAEHPATSGHLRSTVVLVNTVAAFAGNGTISITVASGLAEASGVDLGCATASPGSRDDRVDPLEWSEVGVAAIVGVGGIASSATGALAGVGTGVTAHFTSIDLAGTTTSAARGYQFNVRRRRRRWRRVCRRCRCNAGLAAQIGIAILSSRLTRS